MKMTCPLRLCMSLSLVLGLYLALAGDRAQAQAATAVPAAPLSKHKDDDGPANLTTDTRLDRRVSLHEIGIPLRSLLLKVSHGELALAADRNCGTLELHLNLLNRPLRQLMAALAQLVPGDWYHTPDGKGYVLMMSGKAVGRRQHWWDLYLGERQRVLEQIPAMALRAMGARPEIKGEVSSADGDVEGFKQRLLAGPTFFKQLPASLQEQIAHQINEVSFFSRGWGSDMDEGATIIPLTDLPAEAQERLLNLPARPGASQPASLDDSYVMFENVGTGIAARVVDANGELLRPGFSMSVPIDADKPTFYPEQSGLLWKIKQMKQAGQDVPPLWQEFAAYLTNRVWPNDLPPKDYTRSQDRVKTLEQLADEDHLEFVSDYYACRSREDPTAYLGLRQPGKQEQSQLQIKLNGLAVDHDLSWKPMAQKPVTDQIYLMRTNRWYVDDGLTVPAPLLQRWLDQDVREWVRETPHPPVSEEARAASLRRLLDWQAEVVSTLTPWQIFSGLRWANVPPAKREEYLWGAARWAQEQNPGAVNESYAPFRPQVDCLELHYHLMLFYANLSAEQRTAILAGQLDFNALTADQQQQALYLQPLIQVYLARHAAPILLQLRQRSLHEMGVARGGDTRVRLLIAAPSS